MCHSCDVLTPVLDNRPPPTGNLEDEFNWEARVGEKWIPIKDEAQKIEFSFVERKPHFFTHPIYGSYYVDYEAMEVLNLISFRRAPIRRVPTTEEPEAGIPHEEEIVLAEMAEGDVGEDTDSLRSVGADDDTEEDGSPATERKPPVSDPIRESGHLETLDV